MRFLRLILLVVCFASGAVSAYGQNTKPIVAGQSPISVDEENPVTIQVTDLVIVDLDLGDSHSVIIKDGINYTYTGSTVTPALNFNGTLHVNITVFDGTEESDVFDLVITVNPINDAPTITAQNPNPINATEDTNFTITTSNLIIDDPDNATFTLTVLAGTNYSFSGNTVTPALNYTGPLTVNVKVNDGTADSPSFGVAVQVTAVNDAPTITAQNPNPVNATEDTNFTITTSNLTIDDADNATFTLTVLAGTNYSFSGNTVTPALNYTGPLTVNVKVNDGTADSPSFGVAVQVAAVNDAPTITAQNPNPINATEDTNFTITTANLTIDDPDNATFTLTVLSGTNYSFSGNTVTPALNYTGPLTVNVKVNDGTADSPSFGVAVQVAAVNDAPTITAQNPNPINATEDTNFTITTANLTIDDPDNATFTLTVLSGTNYSFSGNTVTPALNYTGPLTVNVKVNDGTADSPSFGVAVQVAAVNDAPTITAQNPNPVNATEDTNFTITTANLTIDDADNATFTLTVLSGTNYTFSGNTVTPALNYNGPLTVNVKVNDGTADSPSFGVAVQVAAVNDAPTITAQNPNPVNATEDTNFTITTSNLTIDDVDNATFTLTVLSGTNYSFSGNTVTPALNYTGPLTVNVKVNDGTADSPSFGVAVQVAAVNDAPTIAAQNPNPINATEDTNFTITTSNLTIDDPDNATFTLTVLSGTNYTVVGSTVTPSGNFNGTLTIPVRVSDGTLNSNTFNVTVTVNGVNDAPVITGQNALSVSEENPITIQVANLLINDPDNSSSDFTLTVLTGSNYTVSGTAVTPNLNFTGTLSVPVLVNDGAANSNTFNVSITVNAVNDAPLITGQVALSLNEDGSLNIQLGNLFVTDPDNVYPTGFTLSVLAGVNYNFSGNTITPVSNFAGTLTVPVKVNDGTNESAPFNLTVTVNPVNDAPVISGQQPVSTNEDQPFTIDFSNLIVSDPDNSYPTGFTLTVSSGANYSFSGNVVTPSNNFVGTLSVHVRVNDGVANSNNFTFDITVNPVNDPPVITGQIALSVNEDTPITLQLSNLTVTDPDDSYPTGFTLTVLSGTNYNVSGNTITPASNFNGVLTVPVTVNDGDSNSASFNLQITVNPVNDAPQITGQTPLNTGESQPITLLLSQLFVLDPDDNFPADFTLNVLSGSNYSVVGNVVTPVANFSGLLLVRVFVSDGTANSAIYDLQILVNSVNDPPVITGQQALSVNEDTPITIQFANVTVTDPDNTYPSGFTLTVLPGANYTFSGNAVTPALNFTGVLSVSVKVNDGLSDSAPFNLQITVNSVNDAPQIISQQPLETNEDQPITIQFSNLVVTDPDNTYPAGYSLTLSSGSNYTISGSVITPALNFSGIITVPVRVNDGSANSNTLNVQITVNPVNDPPVITGQVALGVAEDTPITIKLSDLTVSDPDNSYPTGFTLSVASGVNYTVSGATVTPALNFNGTLSVNVTVNDGASNSAVFPLQVQVNSTNTAPIITGQVALSTNEEQAITVQLSNLTVTDPDNAYPAGFTLLVSAGANYSFSGTTITPTLNFNGNLTVPVRVNDGLANSAPFNLIIQVKAINDAPVITAQQIIIINEDQPVTLQLSNLVVTDPDNTYPTGFSLSVTSGTNYTVSGSTVTPAQNFTGDLSVSVTVNDGTNSSAPFNLVVKVNPVNDAPTAKGLTPSTIDEDNANEIIVNLLTGFADVEDTPGQLIYQITANDNSSFFQSIAINQAVGELRYKVKPNVFGVAKITIRATDTGGLMVQSVLTITINAINDAPGFDLVPNVQVIENSGSHNLTLTNVTKGPLENAQNLNIFSTSGNTTIISDPVISYDGVSSQATLTYSVLPNKSGTVTINVFAIDDGSNTLPNRNSFTTSFQIEVVEVNNAPTLDAIANLTIQEDALMQNIALTGITAGSGESQALTVTAVTNKPALFDLFDVVYTSPNATGTLRATSKPNANGTAQITVTVTDSGPNAPSPNVNFASRTFNLVIQAVNDLPVFATTPVANATVGELYEYSIEVNDIDNETVILTTSQKPAWATLSIQSSTAGNSKAKLSGTPPANASGSSIVKIQAKDASGSPVIQEYTLLVNTRPVVNSFTVVTNEDVPFTFQQQHFTNAFTDADGNLISEVEIKVLPKHGVLKLNNTPVSAGQKIAFASIGSLLYQPVTDYFGKDTVYWNASDGLLYSTGDALINLGITSVNDAPIITKLETTAFRYEIGGGPQLLTSEFEASDSDGDSLVRAEIGFRAQNYETGLDELLFTNTSKISGTFNSQAGTLSLIGKASVEEYSEAIRTIQYNYLRTTLPSDTVKVVYMTLNDGALLSETKDRFIHMHYSFEDLVIVNAFTPNGDHINDRWVPLDPAEAANYQDAEVRVYNKYGKLVFEAVGFENEWDGTYKGELVPADSYYYTINLKLNYLDKVYQGVVSVLH